MNDRTPDDLIAQARATAIELCTAQTGGMEHVANDVAREIKDRLTADPDQNYAVLRFMAMAVNVSAAAFLAAIAKHGAAAFELDDDEAPSFNPERVKAQMFVVKQMFDKIELTASFDPPRDT